MTPRHVVRLSAMAAGVLLVAATVGQLRPFWWDTYATEHSLEVFDAHRALLMGGAWARILLVFPMVALGVALPRLLDGDGDGEGEQLHARLGEMLAVVAGGFGAVSGVVAVTIGVTAEEFGTAGGSRRALAVVGDCLYWIQDNLLTLSLIAFAAGLTLLSGPLWRLGVLPAWARRAPQASVVLSSLMLLSFYVGGAEHGSPLYAVPAFGAVAALLGWLAAIAVAPAPAHAHE